MLRAVSISDLQLTLAEGAKPGGAGGTGPSGVIARGMGRSYGDAAQLSGGLVLDTTRLKRFQLDASHGTLTAQAGVTLGELVCALAPAGWTLPVVPGTQHVTVGGAIASDVHGKNHRQAGTFGRHVTQLTLLCADSELRELYPSDELFWATVGGMGLTGVIVSARITLQPLQSPMLSVDTRRVESFDAALQALLAPGGPYRVAWLDLLGAHPGRGIVTCARPLDTPLHAADAAKLMTVAARATVPAAWPGGVLRPATVALYNALRFHHAPRAEHDHLEPFGRHTFPLDVLDRWPRLYGRHGLIQYQLAVPHGAERTLEQVIDRLRKADVPCYLAVLKDFGPAGPAPLSFPIEGWTLALDLPNAAPGLYQTLDTCDEIVARAGGRVYLTKDARLRPQMLAAMYPRLSEWRTIRERADPERRWCSDLALRTQLITSAA